MCATKTEGVLHSLKDALLKTHTLSTNNLQLFFHYSFQHFQKCRIYFPHFSSYWVQSWFHCFSLSSSSSKRLESHTPTEGNGGSEGSSQETQEVAHRVRRNRIRWVLSYEITQVKKKSQMELCIYYSLQRCWAAKEEIAWVWAPAGCSWNIPAFWHLLMLGRFHGSFLRGPY